mgnify:CR=1 FL=1
MASKQAATGEEREHLRTVKALPCALCSIEGQSQAHHVGTSMGVAKNHWATIPLCGRRGWEKGCHEFVQENGRRFRVWEDKTVDETIKQIYGEPDHLSDDLLFDWATPLRKYSSALEFLDRLERKREDKQIATRRNKSRVEEYLRRAGR